MSNISKYLRFAEKDNCVYAECDKMICRIPMRYKNKNLLIIDSKISCLGLFDIEVHDKGKVETGGIIIPAMINMDPVDTYQETIDDVAYFVCVLSRGSRFMTTLSVVQENSMGYIFYLEGVSLGNFPRFINYSNIHTLYDDLKEVCGRGIPVPKSVFELIYAELFRDPDDVTRPYRLTDMKKEPLMLAMRDVAHHTKTTHARIIGGYADAGRNAALLTPNDTNDEIEDYFRK